MPHRNPLSNLSPALLFFGFISATFARDPAAGTTSGKNTVTVTRSDAKGIGAENGVIRRDPSDIIKVGNTYYVWYLRVKENPVIPGNHEVLVWPQGNGVAAMIGTTGPKEITNTIQYADDGIHFSKTHDVKSGPWAGGAYRPEAFTESGTGDIPEWGVEIGKAKGHLPFIQRFEASNSYVSNSVSAETIQLRDPLPIKPDIPARPGGQQPVTPTKPTK